MTVTNDDKFSSNINEVIRPVLNFLFIYLFITEIFQKVRKSTKLLTGNKNKKRAKQHIIKIHN